MKTKNRIKGVIATLLLFLAWLFLFTGIWALGRFGKMDMFEVSYTLLTPLKGANMEPVYSFLLTALLPSILLTAAVVVVYLLISKRSARSAKGGEPAVSRLFGKFGVLFTAVCLVVSFCNCAKQFDFFGYVYNQFKHTEIYDEYYVDPGKVDFEFPEAKRNLIYIFLESMEVSYGTPEQGGQMEESLIPELFELSQQNTTFDGGNPAYAGAYSTVTANWTTAAMFAQTSGLPLRLELGGGDAAYESFLPGATTLGDILQREGYNNYLMIGSDSKFGGRNEYFTQHGNYEIFDYLTAIERGLVPEDYFEFWGVEDQKLFEYAKAELSGLSQQEQPFCFTMLTVDTHYPEGYACTQCQDEHGSQYANAISCSSRQVAAFVEWIKQQDFYDNTTIVIAGDHTTMRGKFVVDDAENERKVYFTIINPAVEYTSETPRAVTTMDIFPTTLTAMGVEYSENRLGLGTDLYSGEQTLVEIYGIEELNRQLSMQAELYDSEISRKK